MWNYDVTIIPREYTKEGIAKPLTSLGDFIDQNPDIKIVSLTTPDYLGFQIHHEEILALKRRGLLVFLDAAHGAHFRELGIFNESADIICESWHKTLPVYTGGSVLQICKYTSEKLADICRMLRAKLHTTSPSYVTLSSFDTTIDMLENNKINFLDVAVQINNIKFQHPEYTYLDGDITAKLTINVSPKYFEDAGIIPETSFGRWTNFIITPFNVDKLPLIEEILKKAKPIKRPVNIYIPKAPKKLPRKVKEDAEIDFIEIEDSLGRISATDVGAYPPGVPVLFEGQKITKSHIKYLLKTKDHSFNLVNGNIAVVEK